MGGSQYGFCGGLPKSENGNDSIFVVVDRPSKMVIFIPTTKDVKAPGVARLFIRDVYSRFEMPKTITSDRDTKFTSNYWTTVFKLLGTTLKMSSAYHPQTDGQTERANRTMAEILRAFVHPRHDDWEEHLPLAAFAYNNSVNASTKSTPFFLSYGRHPATPIDSALAVESNLPAVEEWLERLKTAQLEAEENIKTAQGQRKTQADKRRRQVKFSEGDLVMLDSRENIKLPGALTKKFSAPYIGPFRVLEARSDVTYKIDLPKTLKRIHPVFHVSVLKKYKEGHESQQVLRQPGPVMGENEEAEWEIESNLTTKIRYGSEQFLVLYKGWGFETDEWKKREELGNCKALLKKFEKARAMGI